MSKIITAQEAVELVRDGCFIRATYGDESGNLSIRDEAMGLTL